MKKYTYEGREFDSLWQVREAAPHLVFSDDTPLDLLAEIGIGVENVEEPAPDPDLVAKMELEQALAEIDEKTSQAILAGFDYEIDGETYHFSYDSFDQQNFADTANACLMLKAGMQGLPETVTWNAYKTDGELVRLTFDADGFLALYAGGALAHKAARMEEGGRQKADLLNRE